MHAAHGTWDTGSTPGVFIQQRGTKKHPPRKIQRHQADDNPRQVRTLSAARPHPVRASNQRQVPLSDLRFFSFIVFLGWQPTKRPPVVRGNLLSLHCLSCRAGPQYRGYQSVRVDGRMYNNSAFLAHEQGLSISIAADFL